jgi:hypothetical protein
MLVAAFHTNPAPIGCRERCQSVGGAFRHGLFALQERSRAGSKSRSALELTSREAGRVTDNPYVRDYILWGRAGILKPTSRERRDQTVSLYSLVLAKPG